MLLYIRSADDLPHAPHPTIAGATKCEKSLNDARAIDELQALVFYSNQRCSVCFPTWATHTSASRRQ